MGGAKVHMCMYVHTGSCDSLKRLYYYSRQKKGCTCTLHPHPPLRTGLVSVLTFVMVHFGSLSSVQFAGIVQPNNGRCNLAEIPDSEFGEYEYTRALNQVRMFNHQVILLVSKIEKVKNNDNA